MTDSDESQTYPLENDVLKKLTLAQKIQIVIMSLTVVPIRIIALIVLFSILWPLGIIATRGQSEQMKKAPLSGWRSLLYPLIILISRSVYFAASFHWITVHGKPDKNVRLLAVAPHSSYFDSMFVVYMNYISMVARLGADEVPLFGNLTKLCHPIIVNRDKHKSRSDTVSSLLNRLESDVKWPQIAIFPEGTCTNRRSLVQFKSGTFIPGLPVQPVCVKFPSSSFDSVSWTWEGPGAFTLCWLTLCQIHSPIEFHFLPVYTPNEEEKTNAVLYAENVRKLMGEYLDVPLSDYSYEDGRLIKKLEAYKLPVKSGLVKIHALRKKLGISNIEEIFDLIPVYARLATKSSGLCYFGSFASNLGLEMTETVSNLFNLFDKEINGYFSFKQFIEAYFENIKPLLSHENIDICVQKLVNSMDRFKSDSKSEDFSYKLQDLNFELKQKFGIEFSNFDDLKTINKDQFASYFKTNFLHLYIVTFMSKVD